LQKLTFLYGYKWTLVRLTGPRGSAFSDPDYQEVGLVNIALVQLEHRFSKVA
jgi:hypothetical protein